MPRAASARSGGRSRGCTLLAATAIIAGAPTCGCSLHSSLPARAPTELRVPLPRDILSLDPLESDEITTFNVVRQIYEGLADYDPRTLEIVPRLASGWTVSPEGLVWRFRLRPAIRYTDDPCFPGGRGREVTAEDARYSIERALGADRGSPSVNRPPLVGLDPFMAGQTPHVEGLVVRSSLDLELRLTRPEPGLIHFVSGPRCHVVPREAIERYGSDFKFQAVGTGPFRLVSWEPLSGILLVRNRAYWGSDSAHARLPRVDAVRLVPYWRGDQNRLFAEGKLDMLMSYEGGGPNPAGAATKSTPLAAPGDGPSARHFLATRLNTICLRFDYRSHHPAVRDLRLRQAISSAVSRSWGGYTHVPAHGLFPPGLPGFDPNLAGQNSDPDRAARLLRAAGHPGGRALPPLHLAWRVWDSSVGGRVADDLRRAGFRVELALYDDRNYQAAVRAGSCDAYRAGWIADYPDPQTFLEQFASSERDPSGYQNPAYDALFFLFRNERDPERRWAMARRMERILIDDVAAVFLHHERESQLVSGRVEHWQDNGTNPLGVFYYEYMDLLPSSTSRP